MMSHIAHQSGRARGPVSAQVSTTYADGSGDSSSKTGDTATGGTTAQSRDVCWSQKRTGMKVQRS